MLAVFRHRASGDVVALVFVSELLVARGLLVFFDGFLEDFLDLAGAHFLTRFGRQALTERTSKKVPYRVCTYLLLATRETVLMSI